MFNMLNIFTSIAGDGFSFESYLICIVIALICGLIAAFASMYKTTVSKGFIISLILMPAIVATVIIMVNGNVGTGVAVMGAFSLIRFRSVPGKAKDIVSIFLVMAAGLACAAGYIYIALIFTLIISAAMVIAEAIPFKESKELELHITVPESLNFSDAFDEVFDEFTVSHRLNKVKTSNMGSLYKLHYSVELKNKDCAKSFIDKLRCLNGNLEIALSEPAERNESL